MSSADGFFAFKGEAELQAESDATEGQPIGVTLQDLVLLEVSLSWHEAVGVVMEALESLPDGSPCPNPSFVLLTSAGEAHVSTGAPLSGSAVQGAAVFLKELLANTAASPQELWDLLDRDSANTPEHASLAEFVRALSYYDRPNRRADVAALYERAYVLYVKSLADQEFERLRAKAAEHEREPHPARFWPFTVVLTAQARSMALVGVLCAGVAASAAVLITVAFRGALPQAPVVNPSTAATEPTIAANGGARSNETAVAADTPADAVPPAAPTRRERSEPAAPRAEPRPTPGDSRRQVAAVSILPSPSRSDSRSSSATRVAASPRTSGSNPNESAAHTAAETSAALDSSAPADAPVDDTFRYTLSVREVPFPSDADAAWPWSGGADDAQRVFSGTDEGVQPAALVRPQLPSAMGALPDESLASLFELTIAESGYVEQVRLVSPSGRFNDRMLIAAAKAWVFRPALKDGRPVRYRLRLRIMP